MPEPMTAARAAAILDPAKQPDRPATAAEAKLRQKARWFLAGKPDLAARRASSRYGKSAKGIARRLRHAQSDAAKSRRKERRAARAALSRVRTAAFVGVDGEGADADALGRQNYMLLRAGDHELFTGQPLSTLECLGFLCDLPAGPLYVGFSFGYDITMILRDLPGISPGLDHAGLSIPSRRDRLLAKTTTRDAGTPYWTWWQGFGLHWLPNNYLQVCRMARGRRPDGSEFQRSEKGSIRTIYETFTFFQMSFLAAITAFGVGTQAEREAIRASKAERGAVAIGPVERAYCAMEVDFLARMMERLRSECIAADIVPRQWSGAGKLAAALHERHNTLTAKRFAETVPGDVAAMAQAAYYGGRFEQMATGDIGAVWEHDICSAYPAAMLDLPCLEHGLWERAPKAWLAAQMDSPDDAASLYVAPVRFGHGPGKRNVCGLPVRRADGVLHWPMTGGGVYWSVEVDSAKALEGHCQPIAPGWRFAARCDCQPFGWMEDAYAARRAAEHGDKVRGHPFKLGINASYGKLAQRVGNPRWANPVWAGLITAQTRAWLNDAAALAPDDITMMATDGICSRSRLDLPEGVELGAWEIKRLDRMFAVQPGLYWGAKKPKTRGVSAKFFESGVTDTFEAAWRQWAEGQRAAVRSRKPAPKVAVPVRLFVGMRLAQSRGKPDTAGCWVDVPRSIAFDWSRKRASGAVWRGDCAVHAAPAGQTGAAGFSHPHRGSEDALHAALLIEGERAEYEDQPDYLDFSIPWKD